MKTLARLPHVIGLAGIALYLACAVRVAGYGREGHQIVGAIADQQLKGSPALARIRACLQVPIGEPDLTLQQLAPVPDAIKTWDRLPPADLAQANVADLTDPAGKNVATFLSPAMRQELWLYFKANSGRTPDGQIAHHAYHFCDVPVADGAVLRYRRNKVGTPKYDIVQTIVDCYRVLHSGAAPKTPAVTPGVAVILLAHLLGDLHQPLHVGAEYYRLDGPAVGWIDPNGPNPGAYLPDRGANVIAARLVPGPVLYPGMKQGNLHAVWDDDTVTGALVAWKAQFPGVTEKAPYDLLAANVGSAPPAPGALPTHGRVETWVAGWATEILPLAQQAHDKLKFAPYPAGQPNPTGETLFVTAAEEGYMTWASTAVQRELVLGGDRLGWLLKQAFGAAPAP
jgi:hypothetical protein